MLSIVINHYSLLKQDLSKILFPVFFNASHKPKLCTKMVLFCFLMLPAMNDGFRYLNSNFLAFRIFEKLEILISLMKIWKCSSREMINIVFFDIKQDLYGD